MTYKPPSVTKKTTDDFLVADFSANGFCPDTERKKLEAKYAKVLEVTDKFDRKSVSYQLNKNNMLHSWLKYKEGFSADLVNIILDDMGATQGDVIMDPFMGSGTTALVCQMRGLDAVGYDVMPISMVAIKAKAACMDYNVSEIQRLVQEIEKTTVPSNYNGRTPYIPITQDAYPEDNEKFLQHITQWRDASVFSDNIKDLLTLCIINSLERCSYTSKSGQYLGWDSRSKKVIDANEKRKAKGQKPLPKKYVRNTIGNSKDVILEELNHVIRDIVYIQTHGGGKSSSSIDFVTESALFQLPKLPENYLNGVITSPPYCNRYDYTRTYALELVYLGLSDNDIKHMRQELLSCTVENKSKIEKLRDYYSSLGLQDRFEKIYTAIMENAAFKEVMNALEIRKQHGDLNNAGILRMVEGYFTELAFIYAELYRVCKKGATVAFVNDNVRYGGEVIPVDFLSSSFAEQFGFKIKKIYTLRQKKGNSSQQMAKFGRIALRKSITIWTKE